MCLLFPVVVRQASGLAGREDPGIHPRAEPAVLSRPVRPGVVVAVLGAAVRAGLAVVALPRRCFVAVGSGGVADDAGVQAGGGVFAFVPCASDAVVPVVAVAFGDGE